MKTRLSPPVARLILAALYAAGLDACDDARETPRDPGAGGAVDASGGTRATGGGGSSGLGGDGGVGGVLSFGGCGALSGCFDPKCSDPAHPIDSDGDLIADDIEGDADADLDGRGNKVDDDSDGDGVPDATEAGPGRADACSQLADTDLDGMPDYLDLDSDGDGLLDRDEPVCPGEPMPDCRLVVDCDQDGAVDIVDSVAGHSVTAVCDGVAPINVPYLVVPYNKGAQKKRFKLPAGFKDADIYFLLDSTASMQPAIDGIAASLDSKIVPRILAGDPVASPKVSGIPGAHFGVGDFRDVPWLPYGAAGDDLYRWRYDIAGVGHVVGGVAAPQASGGTFLAPTSVKQIVGFLTASGGGDAANGLTQALRLAATNDDYRAVGGSAAWPPDPASGPFDPAAWRKECDSPDRVGRACFRPGTLPVFVVVTDANQHDGADATVDYAGDVTGAQPYAAVIDALNAIDAKVVGVPLNTGVAGVANFVLSDIATRTHSLYQTPGAAARPLVSGSDIAPSAVSDELVHMVGLLATDGLHDVTTAVSNFSCPGNVDCDGDGLPDPAYQNPPLPGVDPTQLIVSVQPVPSTVVPLSYTSIDPTTFFGVRGDSTVEFEVTAKNDVVNPSQTLVLRVLLRVQTPARHTLGGPAGLVVVFLVIPPNITTP